jgi:hypothetical protein
VAEPGRCERRISVDAQESKLGFGAFTEFITDGNRSVQGRRRSHGRLAGRRHLVSQEEEDTEAVEAVAR